MSYTKGPWQVVTTNLPHSLGGNHVETRIFTEWNDPQMKGPLGVVNISYGLAKETGGPVQQFIWISPENAQLIAAAPDLADALKDSRDCVLTCLNAEENAGYPNLARCEYFRMLLKQTDAALAKAGAQ